MRARLTWQVMVSPTCAAYPSCMSQASPLPGSSSSASFRQPFPLLALLALVAFTAFTVWVSVHNGGPLGFVPLLGREPWALQMGVDLMVALFVALTWVVGDARRRGLTAWPFVVASALLGSIGLLSYLVWRGLAPRDGAAMPPARAHAVEA